MVLAAVMYHPYFVSNASEESPSDWASQWLSPHRSRASAYYPANAATHATLAVHAYEASNESR